jgi:hypothetical protein
MPLSTVINTTSSSQDFDDSNDSNDLNDFDDSLTKLNTEGIDFRSSQFRLSEEVDVAQTETQVIVILPIRTSNFRKTYTGPKLTRDIAFDGYNLFFRVSPSPQ